ncbi:MAG: IclR family transcriptional regulator [Devosia sp.]|nr:IclR family transcriptional regulator [Devosia sp.]
MAKNARPAGETAKTGAADTGPKQGGKVTRSAKAVRAPSEKLAYGAPALEKGLDVLELLANLSEGVTQSEIAQRLGRSLQEVYRVVVALERRGYIQRRPGEDGFFLSNRLHDLSNHYPPMRRLLDAALPILNRVSSDAYQAMHLAVLDRTAMRVVAQVDSPAPLGFRLRVGTQNPAAKTASGRLLIAYQPPVMKQWVLDEIARTSPEIDMTALRQRVEALHERGYEIIAGEGLQGITDVSFPILDAQGFAPAVLTMPYLSSATERVPLEAASRLQFEAARTISEGLDGQLIEPRFPLTEPKAKFAPATT